MKKIKYILSKYGISIVFMCLVLVFSLSYVFGSDKKMSESENRVLTQRPAFSFHDIKSGTWQNDMESYASDQFLLRSSWIKIHTNLEHELGKNKFNDVYIGKDNELFQESVIPDKSMMDEKLKAINQFVQAHSDLQMSMLLVPNKQTICNDKLPSHIMDQNQMKTIQKFQKGLDSSLKFIDSYTPLKKHKDDYIFYRSDHHWTGKGAKIVFDEWKNVMLPDEKALTYRSYMINDSFFGTLANSSGYYRGKGDQVDIYTSKDDPLYTVKYADKKLSTATLFDMGKAASNNPYEVFLSGNAPLIDISTTVENTKHLLILKDSYANSFISYLLPYYSQITIVDPRYYYEDLNQLIKDREISDVLFLYNANTFFADSSLQSVLTS